MLNTPDSARRIVVMSDSGFFNLLPDSYKRKILAAPHVVAASGLVYFGGVYHGPSDQLGIAVDADQAELMWPDWGVTSARAGEFRASATACLVPAAMMRKYGWRIGEQIILKGTIVPVDLTLRIADTLGASAPPDALLFRRDYLERSLGGRATVNAYHVMLDRADSVPSAIASIDEIFSNSAAETRSESEAAWFSTFINLDTLFAMLRAMAILVVAAVALVALNSVVIAIRERRTEIAVMRAIGFSPALILYLTVAESALLGVAGGALGCAATFVIAKILPFAFLPLGPVDLLAIVSPGVIVQAFVLSIAIGAAAGLVPAIASVRRSVVESIRAIA